MDEPKQEVENVELTRSAAFLAFLLSTCQVAADGNVVETRRLVEKVENVSIHIYSAEHAPPHFHVKCSGREAVYTIDSCNLLRGGLRGREDRIVRYWHASKKEVLINVWNSTRPGTCAVGTTSAGGAERPDRVLRPGERR